jgi:hypothetical protein
MSAGDPEHDGGPDAEHPPSAPEPKPLDVDSAFAAIVAAWSDETPTTWPADEDLTQGRHRQVDDPNRRTIDPPGRHQERDDDEFALSGSGGPVVPSVEQPEDGPEDTIGEADAFVPPEPPPLPRGDAFTMLAWAGVVLGPLFLVISVIWQNAPQALVLTSLAGFVGGFVTLVARMPKHREDDDDDGAVV